jgi:hypothetical protein
MGSTSSYASESFLHPHSRRTDELGQSDMSERASSNAPVIIKASASISCAECQK